MVLIRLPSALREYAQGAATVEVEGDTVAAVLNELAGRHPLVGRRVMDEQGHVRRHVHVYIGDERFRSLDDAISPGTELTILPAVSGGFS